MNTPKPFTLRASNAAIADLRERLARKRFPDEPPLAPWSTGTSLADPRSLTDYWQNDFDWRAWEAKLNSFPQFTLPVRGIEVYAVVQARPTAFRPRRNHRILQCAQMIDTPRTSGATRHYGKTTPTSRHTPRVNTHHLRN